MKSVIACAALLAIATLPGCASDVSRAFVESAADVTRDLERDYGRGAPRVLPLGASGVVDTYRYRQAINDLHEQDQLTSQERDQRLSVLSAAYDEFRRGRITRQQFETKAESLVEVTPQPSSRTLARDEATARSEPPLSTGLSAPSVNSATEGTLTRIRDWENSRPMMADFNARTRTTRVITDMFETGHVDELAAVFTDSSGRNRTLKLVQTTTAFREVARASGAEQHTLSIQAALFIDGEPVKSAHFSEEQPTYRLDPPGLLVTVVGEKVSWVAQ